MDRIRTPSPVSLVQTWTTDPVPPQLRQAYWHDAVQAAFGGALQWHGGEGGPGTIGSINQQSLADVHLARLRAVGQRLACRSGSRHAVLVVVDAAHDWQVQAAGGAQPVRAGQVAIVYVTAGVVLDFPSGLDAAVLAGSSAWARRWVAAAGAQEPVCLCDADRGWGKILAMTLGEIVDEPQSPQGECGVTVGELLGFALASARRSPGAQRDGVALVDDARRLCRERLAEPDLHAGSIARSLGVSLRTLVRAFQGSGTTFSESVREMRLQQAAALLSDPRFAHLGVAQVGQQCGYVSASHFVREFRRQWGSTPGRARSGSVPRAAPSEILVRLEQLLAEAGARIDAQAARVAQLGAAHSLQRPAAVDLLRTLEHSLAELERLRETAARVPRSAHDAPEADQDSIPGEG